LHGRGDVVEDCVVERTSGLGLWFAGPDQKARRCVIQDHGQLGFSALRAHGLRVSDCLVRNNNTKGFNREWEAGGAKIVLSRDVVIERSRFVDNRGTGVWFDIGDENCTVRNCLVADNEGAGIYYEISYGLRATDNVVIGNGLAPSARAWGAQAGISISSSPHCTVQRNLLVANREGFSFREQERTTPRIDGPPEKEEPISNRDETITNNLIADNVVAQTSGWFGTGDERHWPRALQQGKAESSLDKLNIRFANNLYAANAGQPLIVWGPLWGRHIVYSRLEDVRRALGFERGSRFAPARFGNYAARDFRLPKESEAFRMHCYPRGEVPGVLLGPDRVAR
jgi:parallel beta-helix repeat protein